MDQIPATAPAAARLERLARHWQLTPAAALERALADAERLVDAELMAQPDAIEALRRYYDGPQPDRITRTSHDVAVTRRQTGAGAMSVPADPLRPS